MRKLIAGLAALSLLTASPMAIAQDAAAPAAQPPAAELPAEFTVDQLKPILTSAGSTCDIQSAKRFNQTATAGYYEVACAGADGEVAVIAFPVTNTSSVGLVSCLDAKTNSNFSCTLTTAEASQAVFDARAAELSRTAASKGFECTVSKLRAQPKRASGNSIVTEIGCSNRPESAMVAVTAGNAEVISCARALAEGYRCTFSDKAGWITAATADLRIGKPQSTCAVKDIDVVGQSANSAYLEVNCTDGLPGYMLGYPRLGVTRPVTATVCSLATQIGSGCHMAGNIGPAATLPPASGR